MKWTKNAKPSPDDYDRRISSFLDRVGESSWKNILTRKDPLQELFDLVSRLQEQQSRTEHEYSVQKAAYNAQAHALRETEKARKDLLDINETLGRDLDEEQHKLQQVLRDYDDLIIRHGQEMERLKTRHETTTSTLKFEHGLTIKSLKDENKTEQDRLVSQLLINQPDSEEWEDDKLKLGFLKLHRLVNDLASPRRTELHFPEHGNIGPDIDYDGFFAKNSRAKGHYLIKSVVWRILRSQLFGSPFGFGALGPSTGREELLKQFGLWGETCLTSVVSARTETDMLKIFEHSKLANRWRKITFQSISSTDETGKRPVDKLRESNIATTNAKIIDYLRAVAALSHRTVGSDIEKEVRQVTEVAERMALQCGIHSAQLILEHPTVWESDPAPALVKITYDQGVSRQVIVHHK